MGYEGANVLFDTWVHPLMMGLEEHLLTMFREDFEFHDGAAASHLSHGGGAAVPPVEVQTVHEPQAVLPASIEHDATATAGAAMATALSADAPDGAADPRWAPDAQRELQKIPFFVRGKARRNTERYASERGVALITLETLYDAKAHFAR